MAANPQMLKDFLRRNYLANHPDWSEKRLTSAIEHYSTAVNFAAELFQSDEVPERVVQSSYEYDFNENSYGYLWATNRRVVFAGPQGGGLFKAAKPFYKEFTFGSIASIQFEKGKLLPLGKIAFHISTTAAAGTVAKVIFTPMEKNEQILSFIQHVKSKIASLEQPSQTASSSANTDFIAQLERLGQLKAQGVITDEEFLQAKKKLFDS